MYGAVIPGMLMSVLMGGVLLALRFFRAAQKNKQARSPLTCDVLRGPGHTYLARIGELDAQLQVCRIILIGMPILAFGTHVSYSYFVPAPESWPRIVISAGTAVIFMGYFAWKLMRLVTERRLCRLASEGEVAVGQALNLLMADGCRVFHDFPAGAFKIDHIVIGPTGVMTVQTKTWGRNRQTDAMVTYDGRMLHFPKSSDYETIDQANLKAEWLSEWLSSTLGEDVYARAMVAVPGWVVKRTSADGIPVVNPAQFEKLFKFLKPRPLPQHLMQRIVGQFEERCRNAAASSNPRAPQS